MFSLKIKIEKDIFIVFILISGCRLLPEKNINGLPEK